jgi:hypothetical protein
MQKKEEDEKDQGDGGIVQHSVKRVKKKIMEFIMFNYLELFTPEKIENESMEIDTSGVNERLVSGD